MAEIFFILFLFTSTGTPVPYADPDNEPVRFKTVEECRAMYELASSGYFGPQFVGAACVPQAQL